MEKLINEELSNSDENSRKDFTLIQSKMDELVDLLNAAHLDNNAIQELNQTFSKALRTASDNTSLQAYSRSPRTYDPEMDGELGQLLFIDQLDRKSQRKSTVSGMLNMVVRIVIALLLILLGFGMIIMPAPPYFEMFTLFYLTPNDGVTIMDVISLIVAFTGVYLLISSIVRFRNGR